MLALLFFALINWNMDGEIDKPKLIYVGDPMCSWCYGISEELSKVVKHYENQMDVEVVMGGLRAGGGDEWNDSFKEFLRHHWEEVGMRSGQRFAFRLLDEPHFEYDTEPSCRAVVTVENMDVSKVLPFFKEVQKGFYVGNKDPKKVEFYKPICESMGIDYGRFSALFASEEMKTKTVTHFQRSADLGARSFPTILLLHKGKVERIAIGYSTFGKMKERIDLILS